MKRKTACWKNLCVGLPIDLPRCAQRVTIGSLALILGLAAVSAPPRATATPLGTASIRMPSGATVYLYSTDDTPVLAPYATVTEGGVYTDSYFLGTVNAEFFIVDVNNNILGYVTYPDPG